MSGFKQAAIVGAGLIGASLGLALKQKKLARKVIGIGHHQASIDEALKKGAIDAGYLSLKNISGSDLVILATPVREIIKIIPKLSKLISQDCIVIDVGSTKAEILKAAQKSKLNFVGCHPLAGMEKKGPANAKAEIFKGSLCLIVPLKNTKPEVLARIKRLWENAGARVKVLDANSHDRILAFISHLPHAVVYSLIDCIRLEDLGFAASGLKDTTRIGLSDPWLWRDIFLTNRKEILKAMRVFKNSFNSLESLIQANQPEKIAAYLSRSRNKRDAIAS